MTEAPRSLTLDYIKQQFPPQEETFGGDTYKGKEVIASVSRNEKGMIVYVVPGSIKLNRFPGLTEEDRRELLEMTDEVLTHIHPDQAAQIKEEST